MNKKEADEVIEKSLIDFAVYIDEVCSESKEKKDKIIKIITTSLDEKYVDVHQKVMCEKNKLDDVTNKIAKLDDIINFKNIESDNEDEDEDVVVADLRPEKKTASKKGKKAEEVVNSDVKKVKKTKKEVVIENDAEVETEVKKVKKSKKTTEEEDDDDDVEKIVVEKKAKKAKKIVDNDDAAASSTTNEKKKPKSAKK